MKTFAFLIHPRNMRDITGTFPFAGMVPQSVVRSVMRFAPPMAVGKIRGLVNEEGEKVEGIVIAVPLLASQFLEDRAHAKKRVIAALRKARSLGATFAGLGAFTSVVTGGGKEVKGLVEGLHVTNGNALTVAMAFDGISASLSHRKVSTPIVTLVGATGSIGSALAKCMLRDLAIERLYVVGKTPAHIRDLVASLEHYDTKGRVQVATLAEACPKSDMVVTATSASEVVVTSDLLKEGAIVYDIAQPQNVSPDIVAERPDVLVVDGALVELPKGVTCNVRLGTPKGTVFACMGETILLALEGYPEDFSLGHVTLEQVDYIRDVARRYTFVGAPLTSWGKAI